MPSWSIQQNGSWLIITFDLLFRLSNGENKVSESDKKEARPREAETKKSSNESSQVNAAAAARSTGEKIKKATFRSGESAVIKSENEETDDDDEVDDDDDDDDDDEEEDDEDDPYCFSDEGSSSFSSKPFSNSSKVKKEKRCDDRWKASPFVL